MTWPNDIQTDTPAKYLFKLVTETDEVICNPEPIEWANCSLEFSRDLESGGVFSKFQADSLTFVGNGGELLKRLFETYEVNAKCTLIVSWWKWSTRTYIEFPTRFDINFNFYEVVKVGKFHFGVKVKAINSSTQTKLDNRQETDVDITKRTSIGSLTENNIADYGSLYALKKVNFSAVEVNYNAWLYVNNRVLELYHTNHVITYTALPLNVYHNEFSEIQSVPYISNAQQLDRITPFFKNALDAYTFDIVYLFYMQVTNRYVGSFPWNIQILECDPAFNIVTTYDIAGFGGIVQTYKIEGTVQVSVAKGNSLRLVVQSPGIHDTYKAFSLWQELNITQSVASTPAVQLEGFPIYEALERTCQLILDTQYPIYSDFFGRADNYYNESTKYATENQLRFAHILTGLNLRGATLEDTSCPVAVNFKDLFKTLKAIYNIGYSFEVNPAFGDTKERIRIEEYSHFFQNSEILDVSDRVGKYDIQSQFMPELVPMDLRSGYDSFEYLTLNGRAEPNTTNQRTSIMNTATKWENISPYRADTKGIYDNIANPLGTDASTDTKGDDSVFILKTQKDGTAWKPEKETNVAIINNSSLFKEDLLNRYYTPTRMLLRHGNRITAGMTKTDAQASYLRFQKSDKSSTLQTSYSGDSILEGDDLVVSSLAAPIYKAIKHVVTVPITHTELEAIQTNPFGYITISDTISGYLLSMKKKNNSDKVDITIIEKA